jgi:ABC-type multidrug transport system ATPase subunit
MGNKIFVKTITHSFGKRTILSDLSFECHTGEIVGIFGRNGAGKSTLFNILFGTLKPDHAEIYFDGKLFNPSENQGRLIGYHTQDIMLPKFTKVRDIITMYLPLQQQNKVFYSAGVHEMHNKRISELSFGQQRYLQLLLLINLDHPFVILDEPFSMVEPLYKALIQEKLQEYKGQKGFLISDHYYRDILDIADTIKLIKDGRIISVTKDHDLMIWDIFRARQFCNYHLSVLSPHRKSKKPPDFHPKAFYFLI